jgi:hypothetical protein
MKKFIIGILTVIMLIGVAVPVTAASAHESGPLDRVIIAPANPTIPVSSNQTFTAKGKDVLDHTVDNVSFTWSVAAGGGTINATSGVFTAGTVPAAFVNTIVVTAVKGTITKSANTSVTIAVPGLLDHVVIFPVNPIIPVGGNQIFTAKGKDAFNHTVDNVSFTWSVAAGGGTINVTSGVFTTGNISATFTNTITVTAIKGTIVKTANTSVTIISTPGEKEKESDSPHGWSKGKKNGWHGEDTPPGWSKGKKHGWHDDDKPHSREKD